MTLACSSRDQHRPATSGGPRHDSPSPMRAMASKKQLPSKKVVADAPTSLSSNNHDDERRQQEPARLSIAAPRRAAAATVGASRSGFEATSLRGVASSFAVEDAMLCQQLLIAAEKGNKPAVYLLLHQRIDKDRCRGMAGFSPLHHAAARGHLDVLQLLLDDGWLVDGRNAALETPLHVAAFNGHTAVVECLLDRGADIDAVNEDNETALFYAARKHQHRIVRLLIRRECALLVRNRYGDVAEDEATHEQLRNEFAVGKEDSLRRHTRDTSGARGERALAQQQREYVLAFLDLRSLCRASQVAYRWHRAADNPTLWRRLGVSRWELLLSTTCGLGTVPAMRTGGFLGGRRSNGSAHSTTKRPASCEYVNLTPKRKDTQADKTNQRPQTARRL